MIRLNSTCTAKTPVYTSHMSQNNIEGFANTEYKKGQAFLRAYSEIEDSTEIKYPHDTFKTLPNMQTFPLGIRATPYGYNFSPDSNEDMLLCKEQYEQELARKQAWYNYLYDQANHGPKPDQERILYLQNKVQQASNCGYPVDQQVEFFDNLDSDEEEDYEDYEKQKNDRYF